MASSEIDGELHVVAESERARIEGFIPGNAEVFLMNHAGCRRRSLDVAPRVFDLLVHTGDVERERLRDAMKGLRAIDLEALRRARDPARLQGRLSELRNIEELWRSQVLAALFVARVDAGNVDAGFDGRFLDQLGVLVAVAEEGSLSAAARRLRRTQSAVSDAVDNLERLLDVQLFDRSGYRPVLTSPGLSVLSHAHAVLSEARRLEAAARLIQQAIELELTLAVDAVFPSQVLTRALTAFRDAFPTVRVSLRLESKWSVAQLAQDRQCDLGICGPLAEIGLGLELRPLRVTEFIQVVGAKHALARFLGRVPAAALRRYPRLVLAERDPRYRTEERVDEGLVWHFADYDLKHRSLLAGLGWGFMPRD